jgi:quercetin dioxygenase-like cupin family protein
MSFSIHFQIGEFLMSGRAIAALGMAALLAMCARTWCTSVSAQERLSGKELPQQSEISGITPKVLVRTDVAGAPGKIEIVTRNTYQPGAELRRHYHTSQIVFYILEGSMGVQEDGKEPVTLKPGDTLLIKPGTVHRHWNVSRSVPLVFTEFILVDEGQRSAVFVE